MGTKFTVYHHIIVTSTSLNWSDPRRRGITTATLVKMGLGWQLWQIYGKSHCYFCFLFIVY